MCVSEKTKINEKEAEVGPFFKELSIYFYKSLSNNPKASKTKARICSKIFKLKFSSNLMCTLGGNIFKMVSIEGV